MSLLILHTKLKHITASQHHYQRFQAIEKHTTVQHTTVSKHPSKDYTLQNSTVLYKTLQSHNVPDEQFSDLETFPDKNVDIIKIKIP